MGIAYRLNEYRQQIKFYKDIYKHYYNSKFDNIYNKPYDDSQQIPKVINYACFAKGYSSMGKLSSFHNLNS